MQNVAVLMTVFNRREKTLACLDVIYHQADALKGTEPEYGFKVFMVDDGSTDGTAEAVTERYPQTHVIRSEGNLFWNQGMRLAWDTAAMESPDFYLWINDDTLLHDGALALLLETSAFLKHKAIVVGTTKGSDSSLTYGGRTRRWKIITPDPVIPEPCYTFNGNIVLVPRAAYRVLGNLEPRYKHSFGDYDYGVRAAKAGIPRVVCPTVLGECDRNNPIPAWRASGRSLKERFDLLGSPKGRPFREQFLYDTRDRGAAWAVIHRISIIIKTLFPVKRKHEQV